MAKEAHPSPGPQPARRRSYNAYTAVGLAIAVSAAAIYYLLYVSITAPPEKQPTVARLSAIAGEVSVKSGAGPWQPAEEGLQLRMDDQVRTAPAAGAEIAFSNGNVVKVRPESIVLIGDLANPRIGEGQSSWRIQSGQVRFDVRQSTEILMANATTRAEAQSSGAINVAGMGDTGIRIFKGSARVTTREGDTVTLNANEGVQVDSGGQAGPKLTLPDAPTPLTPAAQSEFPFVAAPEVTTRLSWTAVPLGRTYRVAIDYNVAHADLLLSAAIDQTGISRHGARARGARSGEVLLARGSGKRGGDGRRLLEGVAVLGRRAAGAQRRAFAPDRRCRGGGEQRGARERKNAPLGIGDRERTPRRRAGGRLFRRVLQGRDAAVRDPGHGSRRPGRPAGSASGADRKLRSSGIASLSKVHTSDDLEGLTAGLTRPSIPWGPRHERR